MSEPARRFDPARFRFTATALTDVGRRRTLNEDRLIECSPQGFWAVADGMGGHSRGEAAAEQLTQALRSVEHRGSGFSRLSDVTRAVEAVNATLFDQSGAKGVSGSTLVALIVHEGHYACLWAGDSRAYLLREGELVSITHDHSIVQELIDAGALAEANRRAHPKANVITRAVGAAPDIKLDQRFAPVLDGDRFLLCSDGLTTCVGDAEIAQAMMLEDGAAAAGELLSLVLARGAPDNVSLIVVDVRASL